MNPLDFTGRDFVVFYALFGTATCGALYLLRSTTEPHTPTRSVPTDPQTIAYLRGGATEALRISAVTLLERGLLSLAANDALSADANQRLPEDASIIDRAVWAHFASGGAALSLFKDATLAASAHAHAVRLLENAGLIPDEALRTARRRRLGCAVVALGLLGGPKIAAAFSRGDSNLELLLIEAVVFGVVAIHLTIQDRTPAGDRALNYLTHTFEAVRYRVRSLAHPVPEDVAIVAAVFRLDALPEVPSAKVTALQPRRDGTGCGGGCGGGCGCG